MIYSDKPFNGNILQPHIGWDKTTPVPNNHQFTEYLHMQDGYLYMEDLNLAKLIMQGQQRINRTVSSPLELVYLPTIRKKINHLEHIFADVIAEIGYPGRFYYAYASKANAAEEVVRTVLEMGVHYELSSTVDIDIAFLMKKAGLLPKDRMVICNGFKPTGTAYATNIIRFQQTHGNVVPIIENREELSPLINAHLPFDVGVRQKCYGKHHNRTDMDKSNSRFGMDIDTIWQITEKIGVAPNLQLKIYHAMVGGQLLDLQDFLTRLTSPIKVYAQLRQKHPNLHIFNFGGGLPVQMTLDFDFDYRNFARALLKTAQDICEDHQVPPPDIMGEMGRYTVAEQGAHLFKVLTMKSNNSQLPWYIIDGAIMSSFPDTWALGEHFTVLPINNLDKPFQQVQLGGITCDSDDIYPPKGSTAKLYLPIDTKNLYIGFFSVGAYQEMLGGVGGSKHCVIPEANELIIDQDQNGSYHFQLLPGQGAQHVLKNLGYTIG